MSENQNTPPKNRNISPNSGSKKQKGFNFYWIYGVLALFFLALQFFNWSGTSQKITFQKFENEMLKARDVEKIVVLKKPSSKKGLGFLFIEKVKWKM